MTRAVAAAVLAMAACSSDSTHVFSARRFDATQACLDQYAAVDVVSGGDTGGGCDLVCLTNDGAHYLTRQCAPYPPLFGVFAPDAGSDPVCADAFAAYARGDTCVDGGVIRGDGGVDAGADGGAATDAATDASTD